MTFVTVKSKRNHSTNMHEKATRKRPRLELNETDEGVVNDSDESLVELDDLNGSVSKEIQFLCLIK